MFARVTQYKLKPGSMAEATKLVDTLRGQIMALPGLKQFINVAKPDGSGYVISLSESEAVANGNAARVAEIWGAFGKHLEAPPKPDGYDVLANWSN
ncbi:MAG: hypothetical protein ACRCS0_05790 [Albidovulum sp.]